MSSVLSGIKIAVLGGDDREIILVSELVKMGATVAVAGFPREMVGHGAFVVQDVESALEGAEVLIMPLPGTNEEGIIRAVYAEQQLKLTEKALNRMAPRALIIIGMARMFLKEWAEKYHFNLLEIVELDELAIMNAIPTAEGALQIAMQETRTTIHGSHCAILGFGRVGITLARTLKALGAEVTVVARNSGQLARAYEMGCKRATFDSLHEIMNYSQVVFSTIPQMILTKEVLSLANPEVLIIDLANQPGSTDFTAANTFGIKAVLAPGLPGKVAPISAGKILADVIPSIIIEELKKEDRSLLFA